MSDISAIKRSKAADESVRKIFQTTNKIIKHLKTKQEKSKVFELCTEKNTLTHLLAASCAVHCYDNLDIHTRPDDQILTNVSSINGYDKLQKQELYQEILSLAKKSIQHEFVLYKMTLKFENEVLSLINEGRDPQNHKILSKLRSEIENHLTKSLNVYPGVHWFDHIGELTNYAQISKNELLEKSGALKATALDLEKDLVRDSHDDRYLELATFDLMLSKMKHDFEFRSIRDLKIETFPLRKIINQILLYRLNLYPISKIGIEAFLDANSVKQDIYQRLESANKKQIKYQQLEEEIIISLKEKIKETAKKSPNYFVYYLQNLIESDFENTNAVLRRYGISNVPVFSNLMKLDLDSFDKDSKLNQLNKMIFKEIENPKNIISQVEHRFNQLKLQSSSITMHSVEETIQFQDPDEISLLKQAVKAAHVDYEKLLFFVQKKQIIEFLIRKRYPINGPCSYYSLIYEVPEILTNLARYIYFTFFSKLIRQISRILETYIKLNEDKSLLKMGIKRVMSLLEINQHDDWVSVKIEELMIQRLMMREKELSIIFYAENNAFLVNSFILARLFDIDMNKANEMLIEEPSKLYEGVSSLTLSKDLVSPVSYVLAYEILNRFQDHQELRRLKKEQIKESEKVKEREIKIEVQQSQQSNTLNWVERKITSSLVSIGALTVNPTSLYWTEKDQQMAVENLQKHSSLKERRICPKCGQEITTKACSNHPEMTPDNSSIKEAVSLDLFSQYYFFAISKIHELWPTPKIPNYTRIYNQVYAWINEVLEQRIHHEATKEETRNMIEGERRLVASKIATSIGKKLDKAIYKKFKGNMRKNSR
ncbi:MAG: hypothetical protein ACTSWL_08860 [Promethearchaeota archaeon]